MARFEGLEPPTVDFGDRCSTNWAKSASDRHFASPWITDWPCGIYLISVNEPTWTAFVEVEGIEPPPLEPNSNVTTPTPNSFILWSWRYSKPRPPACKAGILTNWTTTPFDTCVGFEPTNNSFADCSLNRLGNGWMLLRRWNLPPTFGLWAQHATITLPPRCLAYYVSQRFGLSRLMFNL